PATPRGPAAPPPRPARVGPPPGDVPLREGAPRGPAGAVARDLPPTARPRRPGNGPHPAGGDWPEGGGNLPAVSGPGGARQERLGDCGTPATPRPRALRRRTR